MRLRRTALALLIAVLLFAATTAPAAADSTWCCR